jgi:thiaminase/transcriptional activator TenA
MLPLLLLASTTFTGELWERAKPWYEKSLEHPFLAGLTDGSLPRGRFQFYLVQDTLYLHEFSQALKLLALKSPNAEWRGTLERHATEAIAVERSMHESILSGFGVTKAAMARARMAPVNREYTAHLIASVEEGSFPEGLAALLPCYWIYWEVGKELEKRGSKNPDYQRWIGQYASAEYARSVREVLAIMDASAASLDDGARSRALDLFARSAEFEWKFWDMAWRMESETAARTIVTDRDGRVIADTSPLASPSSSQASSTAGESEPDSIIGLARDAAVEYSGGLPNFFCQQHTLRFSSETRVPNWRLQDRVTVDVAYDGGKETYDNVLINGKKPRRRTPDQTGTWSTGEFGTLQLDVLSPATAARFTPRGKETIDSRRAHRFDFTVEQPNSHWRVTYEAQTVYPAYKGTVWIDEETLRVLRLEMQARRLPPSYPMDKIEMTVDYGFVMIGGKKFLMPVKSENLACIRGTFTCARNEIEFRNYRRFASESTIVTTDSKVTF